VRCRRDSPKSSVMVTVSPPVSPSVVAAILMIQKARVTSGTLLSASCFEFSFIIASLSRKSGRLSVFHRTPRLYQNPPPPAISQASTPRPGNVAPPSTTTSRSPTSHRDTSRPRPLAARRTAPGHPAHFANPAPSNFGACLQTRRLPRRRFLYIRRLSPRRPFANPGPAFPVSQCHPTLLDI
jgi:hypothetical protein